MSTYKYICVCVCICMSSNVFYVVLLLGCVCVNMYVHLCSCVSKKLGWVILSITIWENKRLVNTKEHFLACRMGEREIKWQVFTQCLKMYIELVYSQIIPLVIPFKMITDLIMWHLWKQRKPKDIKMILNHLHANF